MNVNVRDFSFVLKGKATNIYLYSNAWYSHKPSLHRLTQIIANRFVEMFFQPTFTFSVFLNVYFSPVVLFYVSGGVEGDMLAVLAPPVHLSGERLGWTMLFCIVTDFRQGRLHVTWRSASEGQLSSFPTGLVLSSKHHGRGAVAVITVATSDWPSYSCSVNPRRHHKGLRRRHTTPSGRSAAHPEWWEFWFDFC